MTPELITRHGAALHRALRARRPIAPLSEGSPGFGIDDAYRISLDLLRRRVEEGERVIGKKIGVTSKAVQNALGVHQPDFGYLTDRMAWDDGSEMPISTTLIQPRAEGEVAFILKRTLRGPGITEGDVIAATECVRPCFEIVDSRIEGWRIRIQDTIADNASSGLFVLGRDAADPRRVDLVGTGMVVEKNGELISTGAGAATLGSPVYCVAWLANTLGALGTPLEAGEVVLSGSWVPLEPVQPGDRMRLLIGGVGRASVEFC